MLRAVLASLPLLLLLLVPSPAAGDKPAKDAAAWCKDHPGEAFEVTKDSLVWRGRLDADRRPDVIINEGECGTRECLHTAYVQCPDGTYSQVMGARYAARVRARVRARGWLVIEIEHVGEREDDGSVPREWTKLRFGPRGY